MEIVYVVICIVVVMMSWSVFCMFILCYFEFIVLDWLQWLMFILLILIMIFWWWHFPSFLFFLLQFTLLLNRHFILYLIFLTLRIFYVLNFLSFLDKKIHILCKEYFHNIFYIIFIFLGNKLMTLHLWWLINVRNTKIVTKTVYIVIDKIWWDGEFWLEYLLLMLL